MTYHDRLGLDRTDSGAESPRLLASWYTQGHSDGLGDRLLMFDNSGTPSLELLRFRPELAQVFGFEHALRERVERLRDFAHPSFPAARAVEYLDGSGDLALVSTFTQGKRLADVFQSPRAGLHPAFATWLIRELTPALADLHRQGYGIAHGALTPDRIVLTPEGRLVIVEHVLGSALDRLQLPPDRLWQELGVVARERSAGPAVLDRRTDVVQLGLVALSVLLGRRLTSIDYPEHVDELIEEFASTTALKSPAFVGPLRRWLEQALRTDDEGFMSAIDAREELRALEGARNKSALASAGPVPENPESEMRKISPEAADDSLDAFNPEHEQPARPAAIRPAPPAPAPMPAAQAPAPPSVLAGPSPVPPAPPARPISTGPGGSSLGSLIRPAASAPTPTGSLVRDAYVPPAPTPRPGSMQVDWNSVVAAATAAAAPKPAALPAKTEPPAAKRAFTLGSNGWIIAGLAALAVVEAAVIGGLMLKRPVVAPPVSPSITVESVQGGDAVIVDGKEVGVTPLALKLEPAMKSIQVRGRAPAFGTPPIPEPAAPERPAATLAASTALADAAARQRSGGLRLNAPIDIQVFEGDKILGSSADGPVVTTAGRHQLDFVNNALGYRSRQQVDIKPGQIIALTVTPPPGRVSVNAIPWAQVWLDGTLVGDTPLANLSVPVGEHQITYRHPQLGDRSEKFIVRSGVLTRVSATLGP